jgi:hypothetical protein
VAPAACVFEWDHYQVGRPGQYRLLAPGAHVRFAGLGGLDASHLDTVYGPCSGQVNLVLELPPRARCVGDLPGPTTASAVTPSHAATLPALSRRGVLSRHWSPVTSATSVVVSVMASLSTLPDRRPVRAVMARPSTKEDSGCLPELVQRVS